MMEIVDRFLHGEGDQQLPEPLDDNGTKDETEKSRTNDVILGFEDDFMMQCVKQEEEDAQVLLELNSFAKDHIIDKFFIIDNLAKDQADNKEAVSRYIEDNEKSIPTEENENLDMSSKGFIATDLLEVESSLHTETVKQECIHPIVEKSNIEDSQNILCVGEVGNMFSPLEEEEQEVLKKENIQGEGEIERDSTILREPGVSKAPEIQKESKFEEGLDLKEKPDIQEYTEIKKEPTIQEEPTIEEERDIEKESENQDESGIQEEAEIQEEPEIQDDSEIQEEPELQEEPEIQEKPE